MDFFGFLKSLVIEHSVLQFTATLMCGFVVWGIWRLGLKGQTAEVDKALGRKAGVAGQFSPGYFTILVIQSLPMFVSGATISDPFIILTRGAMLLVALLVYGLISSPEGRLDTPRIQNWSMFWIGTVFLGIMIWTLYPSIRGIVRKYEFYIVYASIIGMLLLLVAQAGMARQLYQYYRYGGDTNKRFGVQIVRLAYFALQALHYYIVPSAADPVTLPVISMLFGAVDPILFNAVTGTLGVTFVIVSALIGKSRGKERKLPMPAGVKA